MMIKKIFLLLALACLINVAVGQKLPAPQLKACRDSVYAFIKKNKIPGLALTVSINGSVVWSEGFGYADLEQKVKVDPARTKFRIASISKANAATGLALLIDRKQINIDSSIYFYLPDFPKKKYRPTVRQVAGHLAGIRDYVGDEFHNTKHFNSVREGVGMFENDSLVFRPGTKFGYTTHGFSLLSAVMEKAAGEEFIPFMKKNVWGPLQMKNTYPDYSDSIIADRGRFYEVDKNKKGWVNAPFADNSYKWAGGGFISTSEDIVRLGQAYLAPGFIKNETIAVLTTSQTLNSGLPTGYGLGWGCGVDEKGHSWFGHSGGGVGGSSDLLVFPKEKLIVCVLTNVSQGGPGDLTSAISKILLR